MAEGRFPRETWTHLGPVARRTVQEKPPATQPGGANGGTTHGDGPAGWPGPGAALEVSTVSHALDRHRRKRHLDAMPSPAASERHWHPAGTAIPWAGDGHAGDTEQGPDVGGRGDAPL